MAGRAGGEGGGRVGFQGNPQITQMAQIFVGMGQRMGNEYTSFGFRLTADTFAPSNDSGRLGSQSSYTS